MEYTAELKLDESVQLHLFRLVDEATNLRSLSRALARAMRDYLQCDAVGICLTMDGLATRPEMLHHSRPPWERLRLREQAGGGAADPGQCARCDPTGLCNVLLTGGAASAGIPTTSTGSVLLSDLDASLATLPADGLVRFQGCCLSENVHSVAVVALRYEGSVFGLMQALDHRPGRLGTEDVCRLEAMGALCSRSLARRLTHLALEQSEKRYRALFESMAQGVIFQNAEGAITAANPAALRILGRTLDQLLHMDSEDPTWQAIREDGSDFPGNEHPAMLALATGLPVHNVPMGVYNPIDQDYRWIYVSATPQFLPGARTPYQVFATFEDITPRRRAEAARREADLLTRKVLDAMPVAVFLADVDGRCVYANAHWRELVELQDETASIESISVALETSDLRQIESTLTKVGRWQGEVKLHSLKGKTTWILGHATAISDERGEIQYYVGSCIDISKRKAAEAALETSEMSYRTLLESLPDVITRLGADGRLKVINRAVTRLSGFTPEQILGHSPAELGVPSYLCNSWSRQLQTTYEEARISEQTYQVPTVEGVRSYELRVVPEILPDGAINSVLAIARDITESLEAERRYEQLFDVLTDGCAVHEIICDANDVPCDYRFLAVNPAFEQLTGLRATDILGKTAMAVIPNLEACWIDTYGQVALTGKPVQFLEQAGGLGGWFDVVAFCPKPGQFACLFRNVTDRIKMEERLRHVEKMDVLGQLAGHVAHEFNNRLQSIIGFAELARESTEATVDLRSDIGQILQEANSAKSLTRQLLTLGRQQELNPINLDLNALLRREEKLLKSVVGGDVVFTLELKEEPLVIHGDSTQLEQIILNLVINARDAMSDGGWLLLSASIVTIGARQTRENPERREGSFVSLAVADTGMGMSPEVMSHIFEPFYTTKPQDKGTGLGLAMVHSITKRHDGWIEVTSEPGEGTRFELFFPKVDAQPDDIVLPQEGILEVPRGYGQHILLVEDEATLRLLNVRALEHQGYRVTSAGSGARARSLFFDAPMSFDLVFSDVVLPDENGFDLVTDLRHIRPNLKVLLTSGYPEDKSRVSRIRERRIPFLGKPSPLPKLLATVAAVLKGEAVEEI